MIKKILTGVWYQCKEEDPGGGNMEESRVLTRIKRRIQGRTRVDSFEMKSDEIFKEEDDDDDIDDDGLLSMTCIPDRENRQSIDVREEPRRRVVLKTEVEIHPIPTDGNHVVNGVRRHQNNNCHSVIHHPPILMKKTTLTNNYIAEDPLCSIPSNINPSESSSSSNSSISNPMDNDILIGEKMRNIVTQFRSRADEIKQRLEDPPTPDDLSTSSSTNPSIEGGSY